MLPLRLSVTRRSIGVVATLLVCSACSFTVSLEELQGGGAGGSGGSGTTASGGGGGLACPTGTQDCDADGATCEDLVTDGANCGVCGRDCLGGACVEGMCEPVVLWAGGEVNGEATGIDQTVDNVFACTTLGLVRVPKIGGAPLFLTTQPAHPRVDVDGAYGFFTAGYLFRVPLAGGAVDTLAQGTNQSGHGVRVDATHAYYVRTDTTDANLVELVRVPRGGGAEETVALTGTEGWGVQLDDTSAYVTGATGLYRVSKTRFSSPTQLWSGGAGDSMVILDGAGYVLGAGLWRIDLATGNETLLEGELSSGQVATDGQRLYYTLFNTGEVGRIELDGTGRAPLGNGGAGVDVLVVDESAIYFTQYEEQTILKLAK